MTMIVPDNLSGAAIAPRVVDHLRATAIRSLERMYRPSERLFAFRLRRTSEGDLLEGISRRYTAIVLIGLAGQPRDVADRVLAGATSESVCDRLLAAVAQATDPGEVALTLWAARILRHAEANCALERLKSIRPIKRVVPTVELAWSLTALTYPGDSATIEYLASGIAQRLMASFNPRTALFPHYAAGASVSWLRSHVCCYADLVYPIQALSTYHHATGDERALTMANACADRMCELQGLQGQWWWHYDVRTGRVVERYPVYAVHQDAMGPMALFALEKASGVAHTAAIERSLHWLISPPELSGSLIDVDADVIWRKVGRREPGKLSRGLQAVASRIHPAVRVPGANALFPPDRVDYETRPYHMGWILHAFPSEKPRG